jgi:D-glycero-alpha-D-manno-heptose-7-phosphate kinase
MRISAKAPCRVDLAGATLDIWPLYLFHASAVTLNFAIDRYTYCDIVTHEDPCITLRSRDLAIEETFESLEALGLATSHRLPLLALLVKFFGLDSKEGQGITVESFSEAPAGAGISGSSSLMISTAWALNKLTGRGYTIEKIREIAQNIEAQVIRVPTGSQDYYPAMYGGLSAIELGPAGIARKALPIDPEDLHQRFVLAYTGAPRNSGINNWEVMKGHIDGNATIHDNFDCIAAIANAMRAALERQDWDEAGRLMRQDWTSRKRNAPGITTPLIDHLIAATSNAGSIGAKACGAGGGGCVVFLVEPGAKENVSRVIEEAGATVLAAKVATTGVKGRVRH